MSALRYFAFLVLLSVPFALFATNPPAAAHSLQNPDRHQWEFSLQSSAIHLPFQQVGILHPGAEMGYRLPFSNGENIRGNPTKAFWAYAGFTHHSRLETGVYLRAVYRLQWRPDFIPAVAFELAPGLGYLHTFFDGPAYRQTDNGSWEVSNEWGRPKALGELGLGVHLWTGKAVSPFIRYRLAVQAPFANTFPAMLQNYYQLGLSFSL